MSDPNSKNFLVKYNDDETTNENLLYKKRNYGAIKGRRLDKSKFFVVEQINGVWVDKPISMLTDLENYIPESKRRVALDNVVFEG